MFFSYRDLPTPSQMTCKILCCTVCSSAFMYSCNFYFFNSAEPLYVTQPLPLPVSVSFSSNFPHNASSWSTLESHLSWAHLQPVLCGLNLSPFSLNQIVFRECGLPIVYHLPDMHPSFSGEARLTPHFLRGSQICIPASQKSHLYPHF